jgi:hypothetical protein
MATGKEQERIRERAKAIVNFIQERPTNELRKVLDEAFYQNKGVGRTFYHDYAETLREFAGFLESKADWQTDRFHKWKPVKKQTLENFTIPKGDH